MKWINPGFAELFDIKYGNYKTYLKQNTTTSEVVGDPYKALNMMQAESVLALGDGGTNHYVQKNLTDYALKEIWVSFDVCTPRYSAVCKIAFGEQLPYIFLDDDGFLLLYTSDGKQLYKSTSTYNKANLNIEIHLKTGEEGRVDVWIDTKLSMSYRSPSAFTDMNIPYIRISKNGEYNLYMFFAHFILQDTRRIGLEKFKKLTIDPDTEQNMPQGSTTTYKLSGLSDATEFSDITSVCAVLQATSRDANISTGTFSLEGADVGTIDVSDSSGKAYEIAYAETNSLTGKPWTRDDIEGKTLSFKLNGAS